MRRHFQPARVLLALSLMLAACGDSTPTAPTRIPSRISPQAPTTPVSAPESPWCQLPRPDGTSWQDWLVIERMLVCPPPGTPSADESGAPANNGGPQ